MIVVMRPGAAKDEVQAVCSMIRSQGLEAFVSEGQERVIIGVVGVDIERVAHIGTMPGVEQAIRVTSPHKLASLEHTSERTRIKVGDSIMGAGSPLVVMAGPCAVESREQLFATARWVRREGAHMLRGGAYKPRTSPYAFQGLGEPALKMLAEAREETGMPVITELTDPADVELFDRYVDVIQIGARNMHNFVLLRAAGQTRRPVLLKRGLAATIDEWLMAAEYVLSAGNSNVILCERGIRTFERATRNTIDLSAVPVLREMTHLPIVIDPSHGTGKRSLVGPMALAAAAVGADGLLIEVHPDPPRARSDGDQSLSFEEFGALMDELRRLEYLRSNGKRTARPPEVPVGIGGIRERIDAIDEQLVELIEERARLALAVQSAKGMDAHGHDVERERQLVERAMARSSGVMDADEMQQVLNAVVRASRSMQRRHAAMQRKLLAVQPAGDAAADQPRDDGTAGQPRSDSPRRREAASRR
ncbi:MAG TPA: bifunctional 3-deoxy-7-phosphoheptulonate synthase/chorismate mutase [Candidatus Limnocylindrales bacterium]|nr:bifunctional 3-deoxy-7-phosphoheptulonate synthase/chorismate mutase [Candidatus Limnocylindrales bacterium]